MIGLVAWGGARTLGIGIVVGWGGALLAGGLVESVLVGSREMEPLVLAAAAALLACAGGTATLLPALGASATDAADVLREE